MVDFKLKVLQMGGVTDIRRTLKKTNKCPGGHAWRPIHQLDHARSKSEVSFFCNSPVLFLEQPRQRPSHGTKKSKNRPAVCLRLWKLDSCTPLAPARTILAGTWVAFFQECQQYRCGQVPRGRVGDGGGAARGVHRRRGQGAHAEPARQPRGGERSGGQWGSVVGTGENKEKRRIAHT